MMTEATSPTPESSRRYIQWKEEDIGLLLSDLEQPNHYTKWKENKSGYSKRVGEQVFRNTMNHEAIKFKVRWLESRFKHWHEKLTAPEIEQDQVAINVIRAKMMKEFPYYDRCKPIFEETDDTTPSPTILVDTNFKKRKLQPIVQSESSEEYALRLKEIELEYKKMDHQERMQHMKLEQLKLEIELEKLKRDSS